ncbi:hypothetical protein L3Y34_002213 [Caenorhabditis briggsae]|uniref:Uncharacterized protein n=1 Tax=Caenorhabditis briggsae TaxID=6238 RepID=A0AAE9DE73_CAEBR|nr:hypothetical protein L3Y34_002209 [Caenorhabditis briggsae]ULU02458.1 hypothetical protein L3Y34_002211 [Caenorhabditis briggsae]ULU02462.1 hypothetical protein L3Y34_002213 [Caenorhabditis briggsae]
MIDGKFSLMITPTTSRCNGLYIRVKSQNSEDAQYEKCGQSATGALVKLDSSEKTIRKACRETMENFYEVSTACRSKRHPFSKSSEAYLTSCFIKRLEERLETFPDAIYYSYYLQEIPSDAENQVSEVPKVTPNVQEPETANVFSINCVITQPQQIQADAVETPDESLKALENAREEAEKFPEPVQEIETTRVHFVNCVIARPIPEAVETPEESSLKASENAPEEAGAVPKLETSDEPLKALDNDTENAKDVPKLESEKNWNILDVMIKIQFERDG